MMDGFQLGHLGESAVAPTEPIGDRALAGAPTACSERARRFQDVTPASRAGPTVVPPRGRTRFVLEDGRMPEHSELRRHECQS